MSNPGCLAVRSEAGKNLPHNPIAALGGARSSPVYISSLRVVHLALGPLATIVFTTSQLIAKQRLIDEGEDLLGCRVERQAQRPTESDVFFLFVRWLYSAP